MTIQWNWEIPKDISQNSSVRLDTSILKALESGYGQWSGPTQSCSRSLIKKLMNLGQVQCDKRSVTKAGQTLSPGSLISIHFLEPQPIRIQPEKHDIPVLFEDSHLLVINKPPGFSVHPTPQEQRGTIVNFLLDHVKDFSGIGGELRPGIVHRLDKFTSGALVIAKTQRAHTELVRYFSSHTIERTYMALCYASSEILLKNCGNNGLTPLEHWIKVESLLGRNPLDRKKMSILKSRGRKAVTRYSVIEVYREKFQKQKSSEPRPFACCAEIKLETGRTHQIRVHLTSVGLSLLGDPVYGVPSENHAKWTALPQEIQKSILLTPGQALHAKVLGFIHPITNKYLRFEAEPFPSFKTLKENLALYLK